MAVYVDVSNENVKLVCFCYRGLILVFVASLGKRVGLRLKLQINH